MRIKILAPALLALVLPMAAASGDPFRLGFEHRGRLGVELLPMSEQLRSYFGVEGEAGVLVSSVEPESPAQAAGLHAGDVIITAGETEVESVRDLVRAVGEVPEGERVALGVVRGGKRLEVAVTPRDAPFLHEGPPQWRFPRLGRPGELDEIRERLRELERRLEALENPERDET
jgi:membrane-associated protease RseP (regulator of RpoE activity)